MKSGGRAVAILLCLALTTGCAPVYRLIKGSDPVRTIPEELVRLERNDYISAIDLARMNGHLSVLAARDDARLAGSTGEEEAADYVRNALSGSGLSMRLLEFPGAWKKSASIGLIDPEGLARESYLASGSPMANAEGTYQLRRINKGTPGEIEAGNLEGAVALIKANYFDLNQSIPLYEAQGAKAVLVYSEKSLLPPRIVLNRPASIPVLGISQIQGKEWDRRLREKETVEIRLTNSAYVIRGISRNLEINATPDATPTSPLLLVSARLDSQDNPGAAEAASAAVLLKTAELIQMLETDWEIRMVLLGSSYDGQGPKAYLDQLKSEDLDREILLIHLDGIGSTNINIEASSQVWDLANLVRDSLISGGYQVSSQEKQPEHPLKDSGLPSILISSEPRSPDPLSAPGSERMEDMANLLMNLVEHLGTNSSP